MVRIILENPRICAGRGNLRLLLDVKTVLKVELDGELEEVEITHRDVRVIHQPERHALVQMGSVEFPTKAGKVGYKPLTGIGEPLKSKVYAKVLRFYEQEIAPDLNIPQKKWHRYRSRTKATTKK